MNSGSKSVVLLQKIVRGHLCRKHLQKPKDQMTFAIVSKLLENYKNYNHQLQEINQFLLQKKKIRYHNFPSEISENIVKFVFFHKYKIMPTWDTQSGDLQYGNMLIEVKAFSSTGPTTFGPTERWDIIYFLDAMQFHKNFFKVYECRLKNTSHQWQQLKVNKTETYKDHCMKGRRPRLCFSNIFKQLGSHCKLIFEGDFHEKICICFEK